MGDRDYYLDPENENIRTAYKEYLGKLFRLGGIPEADVEKAIAGVMNIETKLAEKSWSNTELRDIPAQYNPTAKAEFEKTYDAIDWPVYYKAMGIGDFDTIIVTTKSSIANANDLMKNAPLEDIRYYLAAQYLDDAASYLSDDFQQASFDFYGKAMAGPAGDETPLEASHVGAQRHPFRGRGRDVCRQIFPRKGQRAYARAGEEPADGARAAYRGAGLDVGRHEGQGSGKTGGLHGEDRLPGQMEGLFDAGDRPFEELFREHRECQPLVYGRQYFEARKPVDKDEWHMFAQTVNAYYNPTTNEICFPAAILQPPFFYPEGDDAINYGAIGVVIGHEMTHGFDDQGRQFDKDGNLNDWWTAADAEAFQERAEKLVEHYSSKIVLDTVHANGRYTLGENIADQGGLRIAYTAFKTAEKENPYTENIDGFTPDQRFYLAYAVCGHPTSATRRSSV